MLLMPLIVLDASASATLAASSQLVSDWARTSMTFTICAMFSSTSELNGRCPTARVRDAGRSARSVRAVALSRDGGEVTRGRGAPYLDGQTRRRPRGRL